MEKKFYETADIEVIKLHSSDIITESIKEDDDDDSGYWTRSIPVG